LINYICDLIQATRNQKNYALAHLANYIQWGASTRANIALYKASKVKAFFDDRKFVIPEDVLYILHDVLRHRIILSYEAIASGVTVESIISEIADHIPIP